MRALKGKDPMYGGGMRCWYGIMLEFPKSTCICTRTHGNLVELEVNRTVGGGGMMPLAVYDRMQ